jgi:hypothetical protein
LAEATTACRAVRTLTAEIAVNGSAGTRRLRGRLSAGLSAPASAYLEAVAPFGPPLFIFAAIDSDATLILPRDNRVLEHGRADAVLDATAGVPFAAGDLLPMLTGCSAIDVPPETRGFNDRWNVVTTPEGGLYLEREKAGAPWRIVANERRAANGARWRAEFREFVDGLPRSIRVMSLDADGGLGQAFDLQLVLSQVELNTALDADVFRPHIPAAASAITLEELRRSGPFGPSSNGR